MYSIYILKNAGPILDLVLFTLEVHYDTQITCQTFNTFITSSIFTVFVFIFEQYFIFLGTGFAL